MHTAAREMVYVAEQGLMADGTNTLDPTWQEMLNHATAKVTGGRNTPQVDGAYGALINHSHWWYSKFYGAGALFFPPLLTSS